MKKFKINENLLALLILGSMFAGWQCLIVVIALIWAFCETGKSLKNLTVKVLALFAALAVTLLAWDVVTKGLDVVLGGLRNFFEMLVSWGVDDDLIFNTDKYLFTPINLVIEIATSIISFIVLLVKFKFIYSVISNKEMKGAFWPVQSFLDKTTEFANNDFYEDDKMSKESSKSNGKNKFCPKCGEKCADDAEFCTSCGNKF